MEGGRDWWEQIKDALNHVEYMVLVMTPAALASETGLRKLLVPEGSRLFSS